MRSPSRGPLALALGATVALALVGTTTPAAGQVLPHAPIVDHLPNGLTVVTVPFDAPGIAAYFTLVRTGSRDEVERRHSGFAHLFEHMMFRGTEQVPAHEYELRMQALGADNNAFTTEDYTLFTVTLPSASLPALVPIEADRFEHLAYTEAVFQTESRAVLGEYNKNAANPETQMWEALSEVAFTRHTYGHTTLGYRADVEAMPGYYDYSRQFFQRFYRPDNCTIVVVGDVQHDAVLALIQQNYAGWSGHRATGAIPVEPPQSTGRERALAWEGTSPPRVMIAYRTPAFSLSTIDTVALEVVHALAFDESSDLFQRLVVREQKVLALESWAGDFHRDPQLFVVEAKLHPGTSFADVEQAVADEMARLGRGEIPADRFAAVVSNLRYQLPMQLQTPSQVAERLARFTALTGDVNTLEQYAQRLGSVTVDDVARVARTYLTNEHRDTITLAEASQAAPGAVRVGPNVAPATAAAHPAAPAGGHRATPRRAPHARGH